MDMRSLAAEWAYFTGAFVTIFFIVDPFALVPIYLTLTERFSEADQKHVRRKATLIALGMLCAFALTGMSFFELFGVTMPAFRIAGGILLLILGVTQLNAPREKVTNAEESESLARDDVSVFPLATPLLAGPGAISSVILLSTASESPLRRAELLAAIVACFAATYLILKFSPRLFRIMGRTGLNLVSRIMGIVLTAVGVQFVLAGAAEAWKAFQQ